MDKLKLYSAAMRAFLATFLVGSAAAQSNDELAAWERAQSADTVPAYQDFIHAFPESERLGDAFQRLVHLKLVATRSEFFPGGREPLVAERRTVRTAVY